MSLKSRSMKNQTYIFVFLSICFVPTLRANNMPEIETYCKTSNDYGACVRAYQGLPPLITPPYINTSRPIMIEVIPYKKPSKASNSKAVNNCNLDRCNMPNNGKSNWSW